MRGPKALFVVLRCKITKKIWNGPNKIYTKSIL